MTWQEEKGFRAKRTKEVAALFTGATLIYDGDGNPHGFQLQNEQEIYIGYNSWGHKGHRLHISGGWPRSKILADNSRFTPREVDYKAESPEITVCADKTAEQVKRDIERRFLPPYRELLAKCIAARDRHDAYITGTNAFAAELARISGGELRGQAPRQNCVHYYGDGCWFDIEVSSDSATFKVSSLPAEKARKLAEFLRDTCVNARLDEVAAEEGVE